MSLKESAERQERSTLVIGADELSSCVEMKDLIDAVEDVFVAYKNGDASMPPKTYVEREDVNGDFRAMPASVGDSAGIKWVNVHPDNPEKFNLPTVMGIVIYSDLETAYPLAIMDGTKLTRFRTGAVAGVASRHLAKSGASSLGLLGAGEQARTQYRAISTVVDLEQVTVSDINEDSITTFKEETEEDAVTVNVGSPKEVAACDIISTTTPSRDPILKREWIHEGAHINAIGADADGKQELAPEILSDANIVVDDWEQCSHSGEINVPVADGLLTEDDIYADLSSVVTGTAPTTSESDITVFDSTGLAIQDIATAKLIYESVDEQGTGTNIDLIGT